MLGNWKADSVKKTQQRAAKRWGFVNRQQENMDKYTCARNQSTVIILIERQRIKKIQIWLPLDS